LAPRNSARQAENPGDDTVLKAAVYIPAAVLLFFAGCLAAGCSINYREGQMAEELEATVPNIRMTGLRYRVANKDRLIMNMSASLSESFESAKRISIYDVAFWEYAEDGGLTAEGRADSVTYFTDTKNAEIAGHIEIISHREKGGIRTERLYWDDARRFLSSAPGAETEIFDEDGSVFTGTGFEADIKRLVISFMEAVQGNYVVPDS
jgi:LPS export ABC transporter protein LptC